LFISVKKYSDLCINNEIGAILYSPEVYKMEYFGIKAYNQLYVDDYFFKLLKHGKFRYCLAPNQKELLLNQCQNFKKLCLENNLIIDEMLEKEFSQGYKFSMETKIFYLEEKKYLKIQQKNCEK
jgi:hypothetical protein